MTNDSDLVHINLELCEMKNHGDVNELDLQDVNELKNRYWSSAGA